MNVLRVFEFWQMRSGWLCFVTSVSNAIIRFYIDYERTDRFNNPGALTLMRRTYRPATDCI